MALRRRVRNRIETGGEAVVKWMGMLWKYQGTIRASRDRENWSAIRNAAIVPVQLVNTTEMAKLGNSVEGPAGPVVLA